MSGGSISGGEYSCGDFNYSSEAWFETWYGCGEFSFEASLQGDGGLGIGVEDDIGGDVKRVFKDDDQFILMILSGLGQMEMVKDINPKNVCEFWEG
ncbi:hypothetical protein Tco_0795519 [Tanacetum coccineum]